MSMFSNMATGKFSKICETALLTWAFFVVGINYAVLGPTLLDLQLFLKQDLGTLSTIPLSSGIGETAGMLFTLYLSKFGHKRLQLGIALLLCSIVISIIPITNSYIFVAVMFFLVGFISAVPSCFLMDVCSELWKDKGTTFQFILVGSSVGAILTPIIVEPFLCHKGEFQLPATINITQNVSVRELETNSLMTANMRVECSVENLMIIQDLCLNISDGIGGTENTSDIVNVLDTSYMSSSCLCRLLTPLSPLNNAISAVMSDEAVVQVKFSKWKSVCDNGIVKEKAELNMLFNNCCEMLDSIDQCASSYTESANNTTECTEEDTDVKTSYIVLGLILLPTSFAFFYYWWIRDSRWASDVITESQRHDHVQFDKPQQGLLQGCIFYTLVFLSFFPVTALTIVFATYLTAFGVQGQLKLTKTTMVFMTSVFWFSTLVGRIISTLITSFVGHTIVIIGNLVGLVISAILLVFLAPYYVPVLWVGTILLGLFACPYEGAGLAWAADYVGMSSNLVALSWISVSVGNFCFPFLGGIMFESVGPSGFLYLIAGQILFIVLMFLLMNVSARFLRR